MWDSGLLNRGNCSGGIAAMLLQRGKPETSNRSPMYAKNACPEDSADNVVDLFKQLALMFDTTGDQVYLDGALGVVEGLEIVDPRIIGDIQRLQLAHKARADLEADLDDIMEGLVISSFSILIKGYCIMANTLG